MRVAKWLPALAWMAGCASGPVPDGTWRVTVTGKSTNCTTDTSGYRETFDYQLFYDGSSVDIKVLAPDEDDGKTLGDDFATGTVTGCQLDYHSAVWLEERSDGSFRWQIVGSAKVQGAAGGCGLEPGVDWLGTETIEVIDSTLDSVPVGCTYDMDVTGKFLGSG